MSMLQFEGDKTFPLPPRDVFAKLSDARFLVECIPNREAVALAEEKKAVCTQRPGFAFVRGTLELTIEVVEAVPDTTIRFSQQGKGIGSSSTVETVVTLTPADGGTQVHWRSEVKNLGGLLKAIPSGLIRGAAQKTIADVWAEIEKWLR
jgi:carbon monoxide dehydrogenase subunit G